MARDITTHGDKIDLGGLSNFDQTLAFWYKPNWNSAGFVSSPERRALMGGSTVIGGTTYHIIFQCEKNFGTAAWNIGVFVDGTIAPPYDVVDDASLFGPPGFCVAGQWVHFAVTSGGLLYVNGSVKNISNGSVGLPSVSGATVTLGMGEVAENQGGSPGSIVGTGYADGVFAELAYYSDVLSGNEIAALARGISPLSVRPTAITNYWPLWGLHSPEINLVGGASSGTLTGTSQTSGPPTSPFLLDLWRASAPDGFSSITFTPDTAPAAATALIASALLTSLSLTPANAVAGSSALIGAEILGSISVSPTFGSANAEALLGAVMLNGVIATPSPAVVATSAMIGSVALSSVMVSPATAGCTVTATSPTINLDSLALAPTPAAAKAEAQFQSEQFGSLSLTPAPASCAASAPIGAANQANLSITPLAAIVAAACAGPTINVVNTTAPVWPGGVTFERLGFSSTKSRTFGSVAFERAGFSVTIQGPLA